MCQKNKFVCENFIYEKREILGSSECCRVKDKGVVLVAQQRLSETSVKFVRSRHMHSDANFKLVSCCTNSLTRSLDIRETLKERENFFILSRWQIFHVSCLSLLVSISNFSYRFITIFIFAQTPKTKSELEEILK